MSQKQFTIAFIVVTIIAVLGLSYSKLTQDSQQATPAPSSSANPLLNQQNTEAGPSGQVQESVAPATTLVKKYSKYPGDLKTEELTDKKAVIKTNKGTIEFMIYPEATKAASNFIFLANDKFYDGLVFHRVVKQPSPFVIQGGDPLGTGEGGPGYNFKENKLVYTKYDKGVVAYAKTATEPAGTGGSQFFIMLADYPLPPDYVIFGKVTKGQNIVDRIVIGDVMQTVTIQEN